ncbi:hypothetical protein AVEN_130430-1 [Araneus ventricosus]|uniref:Uncharacterized protein n=1 Tax=Araneus ventricosus TaxID=182803 RepID=A0A4Y2N6S0_ARAVE|nr:hypothetical protein AVEN_130430-1 [Araneus ventricosus]
MDKSSKPGTPKRAVPGVEIQTTDSAAGGILCSSMRIRNKEIYFLGISKTTHVHGEGARGPLRNDRVRAGPMGLRVRKAPRF